jgi:tetratricopeptide (TPR) repeat protein
MSLKRAPRLPASACCCLLLLVVVAACPAKRDAKRDGPRAGGTGKTAKPPPPLVPSAGPLAQKIHYEQGKSLLRAGKPTQAIEEFEQAVEADPKGPLLANCYLGIGSAHGELREHGRAVEAFRKVVGLRPSDPEAYRALAIGLEDAGKLKEARESLEQALALDPSQLSAYQDLAGLHLKAKDVEGAKKAYLRYELARTSLIKTLGLSKSEEKRAEAAAALGDARDEATAKALGLALTDSSRAVRLAVIRALGQQRLAEGRGPLRALLERTKDPEERRLIKLSLQAIASAPQPAPQSAPAAPRGDAGRSPADKP